MTKSSKTHFENHAFNNDLAIIIAFHWR